MSEGLASSLVLEVKQMNFKVKYQGQAGKGSEHPTEIHLFPSPKRVQAVDMAAHTAA